MTVFTELKVFFQTVDLFDELTVTVTDGSGCTVRCDSMELPEKNTLTMAYSAFCEVAGT